jgi:HEAT repeat protein
VESSLEAQMKTVIKALTDTGDKAAIAPLRSYVENADSPPDVRRAAEIAMNSLL